MKALILFTVVIYFSIAATAKSGEVNISLLDDGGKSLNGFYGCEWRMMNEDGTPHHSNPMYGTSFKGNLKDGTRWFVSVNCGNTGSGSHQIISSKNKESYIIQLHQFK